MYNDGDLPDPARLISPEDIEVSREPVLQICLLTKKKTPKCDVWSEIYPCRSVTARACFTEQGDGVFFSLPSETVSFLFQACVVALLLKKPSRLINTVYRESFVRASASLAYVVRFFSLFLPSLCCPGRCQPGLSGSHLFVRLVQFFSLPTWFALLSTAIKAEEPDITSDSLDSLLSQ